MAPNKRSVAAEALESQPDVEAPSEQGGDEEVVLDGTLVCALTGEHRTATPPEEVLQSLVEQLHGEYDVALKDMRRDVRVACVSGEEGGRQRTRSRTVSIAVYESGKPTEVENIIRAVIVAKPGTKPTPQAIEVLDDVLSNLSERREEVFGLWTNGQDLAFRRRTFNRRTGEPHCEDLTDFPAPDESLEDLEEADRRPLRIASGDSLLRTFKRCHDYLYGNQSMRGDRAFWQLLYLIFAKILDERSSSREFFVGATERNTDEGCRRIAKRLHRLFERVKEAYADVFDGNERIELNDRALAYVAGELARYSLLSTDADAKGMAYEAITSTTLKRERGQFFTPRNVIRMMVEMTNPEPDKKVLDPACGSGGFLVVALAHMRRQLLAKIGCPQPEQPLPSELKRVDPEMRRYASKFLWGVDVDPELRKAARMNMVMNNDGHGNIFSFNSLEFGVPSLMNDEMRRFEKASGGHGAFDFVFTNPPFGAKIPIENPDVLSTFDLGHAWTRVGDGGWMKGNRYKKVAPEILFIEACWRFLKPGTGVMALVLPNGILGNPGEQMESVRWWMLRKMELLASVDLPGEAFLPQVSVQASCVFLRRRADSEFTLSGRNGPPQRPVFMAIAEKCGHGRRGEPRYVRQPDGSEALSTESVLERRERNGRIESNQRMRQVRKIADDLPWIASEYHRVMGESGAQGAT
ncbi:N-6 DNA methylase [Corallococcus exiguus]|uniref:HsdM family class I SAM-dependent methyltransferase n=1 Tax=Corallococcus exiguus TaxID=83462 RepID=UPI0014710CA1|nr:N-6 DNA methylase [Corallococcus exiguus]NNC16691.1 N-6 DNA methylase [Corallococcus exiguus]